MREICYHNISEKSKYYVLKCRVVPSQKMSPKPCHVWAAVVKDVDSDFPGGTIKTAYCICTAGLGVPVTVSRHFYFESDFLLLQVKLNLPKLVNSVSGMYHQVPKLILHHYQLRKWFSKTNIMQDSTSAISKESKNRIWSFLRLYTCHKKQLWEMLRIYRKSFIWISKTTLRIVVWLNW